MFRPLADRILVRPVDRKQSDIIHVINAEEPNTGIVEAKGPKAEGVEIGETIRFGTTENYLKYPRVTLKGETFLVLSEKDVCFVS